MDHGASTEGTDSQVFPTPPYKKAKSVVQILWAFGFSPKRSRGAIERGGKRKAAKQSLLKNCPMIDQYRLNCPISITV